MSAQGEENKGDQRESQRVFLPAAQAPVVLAPLGLLDGLNGHAFGARAGPPSPLHP